MHEIDIAHYSAALDEIYRLRTALAYEARVTQAHLNYATFPKSRRKVAEQQMARMLAAAVGESARAYSEIGHQSLMFCREQAGMGLLTRGGWEARRS